MNIVVSFTRHLHKFDIICTSCITNAFHSSFAQSCITNAFHSSFAQSCITNAFHSSFAQSCITNEYCTVFPPHLHKFDVICTSCITNKYCTVFHPHLHKLHNKWILLNWVSPLICTSEYYTSSSIPSLHQHALTNAQVLLDCVTYWYFLDPSLLCCRYLSCASVLFSTLSFLLGYVVTV